MFYSRIYDAIAMIKGERLNIVARKNAHVRLWLQWTSFAGCLLRHDVE